MERIDSLESSTQQKVEDLESRLTQRERLVESLEAEMAVVRNAEKEKLDEQKKLKEEYDGKIQMKL